jgi:glycosyltransferase involved in cell wall biosynthesis
MKKGPKCSGHFFPLKYGINTATANMPKLIRITTSPLSLHSLLLNQMKFMKQHGFDVIMVSSNGKEWPSLIQNEGCDYRIVTMAREIAPLKDLQSLWRLYRLFKKEKPDIVHSHTPKAGLLAMLAAACAGVRIRIHTVAGLRFMTAKGFNRKLLVSMEKLTGWAALHIWPNSYSLLQYIRKKKLVNEKKLSVIGYGSSNGVDLNRYSVNALKTEKIQAVKKLLKYDGELIYLLSMGRIVKDKGINELMQAFNILYEEYPRLRLIVLGRFEDQLDPISEEARHTLTSHPAIIHIDWSNEVEYFMHLCHLMVHASYREGFPNTLLQAGAMGCPIVCTAIEGNVDMVTDRESGVLFQPGNVADLLEKLRFAISNPGIMKEYADRLRKKVEQKFSQQYVHNCLLEKYQGLLAQQQLPTNPTVH